MSGRSVRVPENQGPFGRLLRDKRSLRKNNRNHVASKLGITKRFYTAIENGYRLPTLPVFALLWQLMEFDANEVLYDIDIPIHESAPADIPSTLVAPDVDGYYIEFGRLLAQAASNAEISRSEIAQAIGVTLEQVAGDETGRTVPTMPRFAQLHRLLGFDAHPMLTVLADLAGTEPYAGFGHQVQTARIQLGKSTARVIQEIGWDPIEYERIELGIALPTFEMLVKLHRVTRFNVGDALTWLWMNDTANEPDPAPIEPSDDPEPDIHGPRDPPLPERNPLDSEEARRTLALTLWPQRIVDEAAEQPVGELHHYPAFWRCIDEQLLEDMLIGDPEMSNLASYIRCSQFYKYRRKLIQIILGMHPDEREALTPSIFGALLDHGFATVSAALRSRLQEGDPVLLDYLRRAIARTYSPRNHAGFFEAAHLREQEAWTKLMTVLLDPLVTPVDVLDALRTGIMQQIHRGIRQGTIKTTPGLLIDLHLEAKFHNSHETVLLRAYRILTAGY